MATTARDVTNIAAARKTEESPSRQLRLYYERRAKRLCVGCGGEPRPDRIFCQPCVVSRRERNRVWAKLKYHRVKEEVFAAYGGYVCACCGETAKPFLSIDHIDGDGAEHRRQIPGSRLYGWLKRNGFPDGFRVLCHNCNRGRWINGGTCPHEDNYREVVRVH